MFIEGEITVSVNSQAAFCIEGVVRQRRRATDVPGRYIRRHLFSDPISVKHTVKKPVGSCRKGERFLPFVLCQWSERFRTVM